VLFLEVSRLRTSLTPLSMTLVRAAELAEPGPPNGAFVFVVILNWNNLADTLECAESVLRSDYPRLAIWVVDKGSDEDASDRLGESVRPRVSFDWPTMSATAAEAMSD
jgi:hypothetical protein